MQKSVETTVRTTPDLPAEIVKKHQLGGELSPETDQELAEHLAEIATSGDLPIHRLDQSLSHLTQLTPENIIRGVLAVAAVAREAVMQYTKVEAASVDSAVTTALATAGGWDPSSEISPDQWLDDIGEPCKLLRPFLVWGVVEPNLSLEKRTAIRLSHPRRQNADT